MASKNPRPALRRSAVASGAKGGAGDANSAGVEVGWSATGAMPGTAIRSTGAATAGRANSPSYSLIGMATKSRSVGTAKD
jgi:hypothetical protein